MFSICGPSCETSPYHVDENVSGRLVGQCWFYKCLMIAETPALHYFSCWSTTKFLSGQEFSAGLVFSFSVHGSKSWATVRSHEPPWVGGGIQKGTSAQNHAKMLARGPKPHKTCPIRWGKGDRKVTQAKWMDLWDPSVFTMKTSQPTPMQHTPLQPPQVITLGLCCFLWSCNGSETVSNETKGSLSINSMGSGSGPTSVWPSLYAAQPIYSLSIPGPPSPIVSIFFLLMVVISHAKHHPQKKTIPTPLAAKSPA